MKTKTVFSALAIALLVSVMVLLVSKNREATPGDESSREMIDNMEAWVLVSSQPGFSFKYDVMKTGVLQHVDREYTYDVIPSDLENGILFRGIHRLPLGTVINLEVKQALSIYFFFHHTEDGGYTRIFSDLEGWEKCSTAPQYDIFNGDHGLNMVMYKRAAERGTITIPATQKDKACFNMVFIPGESKPE